MLLMVIKAANLLIALFGSLSNLHLNIDKDIVTVEAS